MMTRHALTVILGLLVPVVGQAASPTIDELEEHLARLRDEYNTLIARMHVVGLEVTAARETVARLQARLADEPKNIGPLWDQLQRARNQLSRLEERYAGIQEQLIILLPRIRRVERLIEFLRDQDDPGD